MGLSSSKTKTETQSTNNEQATTTPVLPDWVMPAFNDYSGRIDTFGNADPNSFVAGASPLQQMAWGNTDKLSGWQPQANQASALALQSAQAPTNSAGSAKPWTA